MLIIKIGRTYWKCKCDCGNTCIAEAYKIKTGHTTSCGCVGKENIKNLYKLSIKHQKMNTRLYRIWENMKRRCDWKKHHSYEYYGGRGIEVCEEWRNSFILFYNWAMENGYKENLTIDRINVNGNYEPSNCRWADSIMQANNKRNNRIIEYNGKTLTLIQWSRITGIKRETICWRIKNGFPLEKVFSKENFSKKTKRKEISNGIE